MKQISRSRRTSPERKSRGQERQFHWRSRSTTLISRRRGSLIAPPKKKENKSKKKWRQAQRAALRHGLVTMHDFEMVAGGNQVSNRKDEGKKKEKMPSYVLRLRKRAILLRKKGEAKYGISSSSSPQAEKSDNNMMEL